ncbi:hypothetical protein JZO73_13670 [Enterococcus plantarum]|uniref:ArdC-like ssDNA-binding domain-containing protein n=1 Tax=Enterococcus plantarum TaxID=1077675 RepID=UPI001A8C3C1E|nr:ArdC-like ssDNA-binding domain-containing protein [Enterococcus plantarum]MBO0468553.1 hypothetical protein [Enterococcus plantarum]
MAEKEKKISKLDEISEQLTSGLEKLYESEHYKTYLKTMGTFHKYSVNNTILIALQNPNDTLVAGYNAWSKNFKRQVVRGSKAIKIMAPAPYTIKEEMDKIDPKTQKPVLDAYGKAVTEEVEITIPKFKVAYIFDVSQTIGRPIPSLVNELTGNVENYDVLLEALQQASPLPIEFEKMTTDIDGYCLFGERIAIREGMSQSQTIVAIVHEMTHAKLHDKTVSIQNEDKQERTRPIEEIEAESVAFAVSHYYNIDSSDNSLGYIAEWSKDRQMSELKASLAVIKETSGDIITTVDKNLIELANEKGLIQENVRPELDSLSPIEQTAWQLNDYMESSNFVSYWSNVTNENEHVQWIVARLEQGEIGPFINMIQENVNKEFRDHLNDDNRWDYDNPDFPIETALVKSLEPYGGLPPKETPSVETVSTPNQRQEVFPDNSVSIEDRNSYGYTDIDVLPLKENRALELFDKGESVYLLYPDNTEAIALDRQELENHTGIFGIDKKEWANTQEFKELVTVEENKATPPLDESSPTVADFEEKVKAGETISLYDLGKALKNEQKSKEAVSVSKSKPSILQQISDGKKKLPEPKENEKAHTQTNQREM